MPVSKLLQRVQRRDALEKELFVDPAFFHALRRRVPAISGAAVRLRRGLYHNEFAKFHYDVVLTVSGGPPAHCDVQSLDWQRARVTVSSLHKRLASSEPDALLVTGVPNARLAGEMQALELLAGFERPATAGALRQALRETSSAHAIDPEAFWALEADLPYSVDVRLDRSGALGAYDVLLTRRGLDAAVPSIDLGAPPAHSQDTPWGEFGNNMISVHSGHKLVPELRRHLCERLPEHMVPTAFVFMGALPLSPNGKLHRQALPAPGHTRPELDVDFVAPRGALEQALADMWSELLGLEEVGVQDDFFDLGGHSLTATQLISRIRDAFDFEVPIQAIFDAPTIETLGERLRAEVADTGLDLEAWAELLSEVNGLSDDEVGARIAAKETGLEEAAS